MRLQLPPCFMNYDDIENLKAKLKNDSDQIQCIVSRDGIVQHEVDFGTTQHPKLTIMPIKKILLISC